MFEVTMRRELMPFVIAAMVAPSIANAQRRPLTVEPLRRIPHEVTAPRVRFDPTSRTVVHYPVNGRIDALPGGDFLLSWDAHAGGRAQVVWEPPNKLSAIVEAEVSFDSSTQIFTYSYKVVNQATSAQKLKSVYLGATGAVGRASPGNSWYSRGFTPFLKATLGTDGWVWSQVLSGRDGLQPGESVSGLSITSPRPPGIVKVYVEGQRQKLRTTEDLPEELHAAIDRVYFRLPVGVTIGPVADATTGTQAEVQTVIAMLGEAERQGWLGTPASARSVMSSVASIRSSVMESDSIRATQERAALLRTVRSQQFEGMLSEGRAVLEFRLTRWRP